jgi:hypothetical protein
MTFKRVWNARLNIKLSNLVSNNLYPKYKFNYIQGNESTKLTDCPNGWECCALECNEELKEGEKGPCERGFGLNTGKFVGRMTGQCSPACVNEVTLTLSMALWRRYYYCLSCAGIIEEKQSFAIELIFGGNARLRMYESHILMILWESVKMIMMILAITRF